LILQYQAGKGMQKSIAEVGLAQHQQQVHTLLALCYPCCRPNARL
jgi:hypothetical protein